MNFFDFKAVNEQVCNMYAQSCNQWLAAIDAAQDAMITMNTPAAQAKPTPPAQTKSLVAPAKAAEVKPDALVTETRKHLLQSTTFLTKVAAAIEAFYARVNETLLYVKMLEAQTALTRQLMQASAASHAFMASFAQSLAPYARPPQYPAPPPLFPAGDPFPGGFGFSSNPAQSIQQMTLMSEATLATVPVMALIAGITSAYQDLMPRLAEAFSTA